MGSRKKPPPVVLSELLSSPCIAGIETTASPTDVCVLPFSSFPVELVQSISTAVPAQSNSVPQDNLSHVPKDNLTPTPQASLAYTPSAKLAVPPQDKLIGENLG